jgi:hypothetical protein
MLARFSFSVTSFVIALAQATFAFAADNKKDASAPVDSTVMFKQIPNEGINKDPDSIFELPDIVLPTTSEVKEPAPQKTDDDETESITLPIPMINLGISKDIIPASDPESKILPEKKEEKKEIPLANMVDASQFDIAGIFLGDTAEDVLGTAKEQGFEVSDIVYSVPSFLQWRYRDICQDEGIVVYEQRRECINQLAEKNNQRYISEITISKPELKEKVTVSFTSSYANNLAYRIVYDVQGDYSLGTSAEPVFKKRERRKAFWQRVFTKYGMPSDLTEMLWTEGYDKASLRIYMNVSTTGARIVLEDIGITDADTYRMYRANQMMPSSSTFSF